MGKILELFNVYAVDGVGGRRRLGRTRAVSSEKAINNVRFRFYDETPIDELGIRLEAEVITGAPAIAPRLTSATARRPRERQLVWSEMLRPNPAY